MTMKVSLREVEYEGTRYYKLFGTPERAARTLLDMCKCAEFCDYCPLYGQGVEHCEFPDATSSVLEWLRGDA